MADPSRFRRFLERFGEIQTKIVLTIIYFVVLAPLALLLRILRQGDLLELERPASESFARTREPIPTDRERCERQF